MCCLRRTLGREMFRNLVVDSGERKYARTALFGDKRDVETEAGFENRTEFAERQIKHHVLKLFYHHAALDPAKVTSIAGTVRIAVCHFRERLAAIEFIEGSSHHSACRIAVRRLIQILDDVIDADLLRHVELGPVGLIVERDFLARRPMNRRVCCQSSVYRAHRASVDQLRRPSRTAQAISLQQQFEVGQISHAPNAKRTQHRLY